MRRLTLALLAPIGVALAVPAYAGMPGPSSPQSAAAATAMAAEVPPGTGPMLSLPYDIGEVVQSLDFIDVPGFVGGASYQLPFHSLSPAFSPDGASLAYPDGLRIRVRDASGTSTLLQGSLPPVNEVDFETLEWAGDGSYVIASTYDEGADTRSLWRFSTDAAPVKVHTQPNWEGLPFAVDPDGDDVAYIRSEEVVYQVQGQTYTDYDQEIYVRDLTSGVETLMSHNCVFNEFGFLVCERLLNELAWSPTGDRLIVNAWHGGGAELAWFDLTTKDFSRERIIADRLTSRPFFSADGSYVAWIDTGGVDDQGTTRIAAVGGAVVKTLQRPYLAFQPCPGGGCPHFVRSSTKNPSSITLNYRATRSDGIRTNGQVTPRRTAGTVVVVVETRSRGRWMEAARKRGTLSSLSRYVIRLPYQNAFECRTTAQYLGDAKTKPSQITKSFSC